MPVSSSTEHWIKPDALTINLNHFGDPDYLQVSVLAGAVVMAFKQDVIGYNAAHNYRTWSLEAANTYLETSSAYNVYARLTRSEVNARALVVYDSILRDIEGREITYAENGSEVLGNADADYFFIFLGRISSNIDSNGQIIQREWIVDFRFGNLDTNQQKNDKVGLLDLMFRPHYENPLDPNEITWIEALTHLGVAGGITMYANGGLLNIPSIYDGLPIDSQTIYWDDVKDSNGVVVGKILKAKTGGGGGSGGSADFSNVLSTGSGNAYTSFVLSDDKKTLTFVKSEKFALSSELESKWTADEGLINNWNTAFGWGNHSKAGYAEKNYVDSTFVTIAGSKDITGVHDFVNGLKINGNPITYNKEKDCWKLEGNLIVTGGVTMYGDSDNYDISSIYDALPIDGQTIYWEAIRDDNGVVIGKVLKAQGGGGVADSVAWSNVYGKPTWLLDDKINYSEIDGIPDLSLYQPKITSTNKLAYSLISGTPDLSVYALNKDIPSLNGYATEQWVKDRGYATTDDLDSRINSLIDGAPAAYDTLKEIADVLSGNVNSIGDIITTLGTKWTQDNTKISNWDSAYGWGNHANAGYAKKSDIEGKYVTISGNEDVTGLHDFINGLKIGGIKIHKSKNGVIYIEGNIAVKGGVTMYGTDSSSAPSILDSLPVASTSAKGIAQFNSTYFSVSNGVVSIKDGSVGLNESELNEILNGKGYLVSSDLGALAFKSNLLAADIPSLDWSKITSGKPTTISGYGITDAITTSNIGNQSVNYATSAGNAATATKLANSRTIWGQPFDGTKDINGVLYTPKGSEGIAILDSYIVIGGGTAKNGKPTYIDGNDIYFRYGTSMSMGMTVSSSGNVGIGTDSPTSKLHVNGDVYSSGNISLSSILTIDGIELKKSNDDVLYIDGNLVVRGGITMYGTNSTTSPTIWEGIPIDNDTIYWDNGVLKAQGGGGGVAWADITGKPTFATVATSGSYNDLLNKPTLLSSFTNDLGFVTESALSGKYLPITGGTLTGDLGLAYNSSNNSSKGIRFQKDGSSHLYLYRNESDLYFDGGGAYYKILRSDNYSSYALPLSGGALTGNVYFGTDNTGVNATGSATRLPSHIYRNVYETSGNVYDHYYNNNYTASTNTFANLRVKTSGGFKVLRFGGDGTFTWDGKTIYHSGNLTKLSQLTNDSGFITSSASISGNAATATKLATARTIWGQSFNGSGDVTGSLYDSNDVEFISPTAGSYLVIGSGYAIKGLPTYVDGNNIYFRYGTSRNIGLTLSSSGNVGIGMTSPAYKLHVAGTAYISSNLLTGGGITMYSARVLKNVVDERGLSLRELSVIKPTRYTWKDKRDERLHIGGIADDIEQVLPEVVYRTPDGVLTMDYGNAGFAIASSLIQPVISHEERIARLERENRALKEEIERLKRA